MRSGPLRHKISIETVTQTDDGYGGFTETWVVHTTAKAEIKPMKGEERMEFKKLGHELMHRIWMRYQTGVTPKMRIVFGDRTMQIIDVRNPDERSRSLEILAEENTD